MGSSFGTNGGLELCENLGERTVGLVVGVSVGVRTGSS